MESAVILPNYRHAFGRSKLYAQDECLLFSLKHQQLEGVIQLAYKVIYRDDWIDLVVKGG